MDETIRTILSEIGDLLESGGEHYAASLVQAVLSGSEQALDEFLVSNELWGGSGSIADQCFVSGKAPLKAAFEGLMIKLGQLQLDAGKTNVRTEMWRRAFEQWRKMGLR